MRLLLAAVLVTTLLLVLPLAAYSDTRIALIAGFSGPSAQYGAAYRNGIELAELPQEVIVKYEDDQFLPAKTITAFNKLTQFDNVSTILVGDTVTAQAIAPLAKSRSIRVYAWASAAPQFANNEFITRLWPTDEADYGYLVDVLKARNIKRVALFTSVHTYADNWGRFVAEKLPGSTHQSFSVDPTSYQVHILKALRGNYDAFGLCLSPGANGVFARQLRQLKSNITLFACDFVESGSDVESAQGALDGAFFTAPTVSKKFTEAYTRKAGTSTFLFSAALFHDAVLLATSAPNPRFAISGLKVVTSQGSKHLEFPFSTFRITEGSIAPDR